MEDGQHQFFEKVFPAELEEIKQRRKTVGLWKGRSKRGEGGGLKV
jgi:hypothetical protein